MCTACGLLFLAGCDKPSTVNTSAPRINKTQSETAPEDVLPPQSEPPVVDDKAPADETGSEDKSKDDPPAKTE